MITTTYRDWHKIYNFLGLKFKIKLSPTKKSIVNLKFEADTGIGNRILGLIGYIYYTKPDIINMYWDNKTWVTSCFEDIFTFDSDIQINETNDIKDCNNWNANNNEIIVTFPPCCLMNKRGKSLSLKYNKIERDDIDCISEIFKKLKPSNRVKKRIQSMELPQKCIALQIRNNKDWNEYGRNETINSFFEEIEKQDKDTYFYLSAMNNKTSQILKERYSDRIIELDNKNYSSMIDAVSDLYLMSSLDKAIYSYGSTFGELAFWLANGKQEVKVIGSKKNWNEDKY